MSDIYKNTKKYNPNRKRKILIASDDMISEILSNKKLNPVITDLFIRGIKPKHFSCCITQSYIAVPKHNRLYSTHYFILKILNKQKLEQTFVLTF